MHIHMLMLHKSYLSILGSNFLLHHKHYLVHLERNLNILDLNNYLSLRENSKYMYFQILNNIDHNPNEHNYCMRHIRIYHNYQNNNILHNMPEFVNAQYEAICKSAVLKKP